MEKGVITIDWEANIRSVNHVVVSMFGYRSETDLIGKSLNMIVPSPYKEQHDSFIQNYRRTGVGKIIGRSRVVEGLHSDGSVFPMRICVSELKVGDQKIFCGLLEKLSDETGTLVADEEGRITTCNSQLCNIFGYTKRELLGQNVSLLADSPHDTHHDEYIRRYLKTGETRVLGRVRNLTGKHKDGSPIVISLEVNEAKKDGKRIFVSKIRQITEEMEALVTIDINGIIRSVNKNLWTTFGYKEEELVGKNVKILMPHPHRELHDNYLKRYARTRQKRIIGTRRILKAKHKDGSMFYIYLEVNEFEKDGETLFGGKVTRVLRQPSAKKDVNPANKYIGNYVVQKTLVDGLYGKVKLALHQLTQERVIIKVIERSKIDQEKFREIAIMRKLRHPSIVRLLEVIESTEEIYIIIEYIGGGELFDYALDRTKLSEEEARKFWRQMVQGVLYMHDCHVVHRDLKLENIMLDEEGNVVIIDMGLSNFISEEKMLKTFCGSTSYAAPEMFLCHDYKGPEVDVWSLGVILYCLVLGYLPFEDPQHIIDADPIPPEDVSKELVDLFAGIFKFEPSKRYTMEQLRTHPWTNKGWATLERTRPESMQKFSVEEHHLKILESYGFEHKDIVSSISKGEFNQITSSLFLLEKKERLQALSDRKEKEKGKEKDHHEKEKKKDRKEKKEKKEKKKDKKEKKDKSKDKKEKKKSKE